MDNNKIQINCELNNYLDIDIIDNTYGDDYDDIDNQDVEIDWTASVEEVLQGVQLTVYSIDKIYFKYDIIKWTDNDGDQIVETVEITINPNESSEWKITNNVSYAKESNELILHGISINKDKKEIDLQFN